MFINLRALLVLALLSSGQAQSSSSVYVQPTVPTGTPVPGNYSGALRPQIHFSPPQWFMVSESPVISRFVHFIRFTPKEPKEGCVLCFENLGEAESDCIVGQVLNRNVCRTIRTDCLSTATESIISTISVCSGSFPLPHRC